jgi:superfamily II DNA or RNA helicase
MKPFDLEAAKAREANMTYKQFIDRKKFIDRSCGFDPQEMRYQLKDFQRDITAWACRKGKSAIFADTGLGKTWMQLAWADLVSAHAGPVLILAPLAVSEQTIGEGKKCGVYVEKITPSTVIERGVYITNYEQLGNIDTTKFAGIVLDESSILKGFDGKTRKLITELFSKTFYRLSCTATPSPNDLMEFGTQAEFLGIMSVTEMLATFFTHDGSDTSKWRLKGHGRTKFWEWLSTWAVFIRSPSDYGYDSTGYDLPPLIYHEHVVDSGVKDGLLPWIAQSLSDRQKARRDTINQRVEKAAEIANSIDGQCLIWCHLNEESEKLENRINNSVQVFGSQKAETKANYLLGFASGDVHRLITKPSIAGFGMNWQNCRDMVFVGLSDSFEQYYQAVRRCWRFGQTMHVNVHIVSSDSEGAVVANIKSKEANHNLVAAEMLRTVKQFRTDLKSTVTEKNIYIPNKQMEVPKWMC